MGLTPDGGERTGESAGTFEQAQSSKHRDETPNVSEGDRAELAASNTAFERSLDPARLERILRSLASRNMNLTFPRYELEGAYDLVKPLQTLGMKDAFRGGFPGGADFSGIDGTTGLSISGVFQKTFVSIKETGTEAAAATGVTMGITSVPPPPIDVNIDRPFLFLIRDLQTKTIVFLGRLIDPSAG